MSASRPAIERILDRSKRDEKTGCLVYKPALSEPVKGRGLYIKDKGKTLSVMRVVYEHHNNMKLSATQQVRHTCNNMSCVEGSHLVTIG